MMPFDIHRAARDLAGAAKYLLTRPRVTGSKVGVVGFCMGGQLALAAACQSADVGAAVDFYGVHQNVKCDFTKLSAPVLGLFAERDAFVTPAAARKLEADIRAAGKSVEVHIYPGVDHAFFNDTRPDVYNREAATDAWNRTLDFFRRNLR